MTAEQTEKAISYQRFPRPVFLDVKVQIFPEGPAMMKNFPRTFNVGVVLLKLLFCLSIVLLILLTLLTALLVIDN